MEDIPLNMQVTNSKSRNIYFDILVSSQKLAHN